MKLKICLMGLLCLYFSANAQNENIPTIIKIGDKVPDLFLLNIMNSKLKAARLSDYKGKLVFLDFWETSCGNCIVNFPRLDSLQKQFGDKIQIFLVNGRESENQITMFLKRQRSWNRFKLKLPIIHDLTIYQYFKFHYIPNCAWISPEGKLIAITDDDPVNAENIQKILHGEKMKLPVKDDFASAPSIHKPQILKKVQ